MIGFSFWFKDIVKENFYLTENRKMEKFFKNKGEKIISSPFLKTYSLQMYFEK